MNLSFGKFAVKSDIPIIMLVSDDSLFSINGFFSLGTVITHISLRQNNHHPLKDWRCWWDSNPRWLFSTLPAFQVGPLSLLGTATYSYFYYNLSSYIFQEISKEKKQVAHKIRVLPAFSIVISQDEYSHPTADSIKCQYGLMHTKQYSWKRIEMLWIQTVITFDLTSL